MKPGDRVEMTAEGLRLKMDGRKHRRTGTVTKIYNEYYIRVLRDGETLATRWSAVYWKVITSA